MSDESVSQPAEGAPPVDPVAAASDSNVVALRPGTRVGRYEIASVLGHGGFGITYRAHILGGPGAGTDVALKEYLPVTLAVRQGDSTVLPRSTQAASDFSWGRERFVTEGRTLASLSRAPAIVRLLDFVEANGTAYIAMELLRGETLGERLRRRSSGGTGTLSVAEIRRLLWPLLDGLEQVHAAGFLHRDIKPANIMLDAAGLPTLIDFGAAREAVAGRSTTLTAIFTPGFGAAEQFTAGRQGPWTDIYGLAATLYNAATGAPPPNSVERLIDDDYRPLFGRAATDAGGELPHYGLPEGIAAGIDLGLAVRADERPSSIAAWRELLQSTAPQAAIATRVMRRLPGGLPETMTAPAPAPRRRYGWIAGLAGAALALVALAGAGGYYLMELRPRPSPPALETANVEQLERALAARRRADAEAADKRAAEAAAMQRAQDEARAQQAADEALAKAKQESARATEEFQRRQQAMRDERTAATEQEQQKAMMEMAARRQEEAEAQRKADADAAARRQADEALARAKAEREAAEAAAKAQEEAEAKMKAEADAKVRAEMEEKQKALAEATEADRKAEAALNMTADERKRLQVALSSLGFDTRGTDGNFGPRTRDMVAAWQGAAKRPPTGYLDNSQRQALLKAAAPAVAKYDDDLKLGEQKKIEEEKQKEEDERKRLAAAAPPAPRTPAPAPAPAPGSAPGAGPGGDSFAGSFTISHFVGAQGIVSLQLTQNGGTPDGGTLRGQLVMAKCGATPVSLAVSPSGQVSGAMETFNGQPGCAKEKFTVTGQIGDAGLKFSMTSVGAKASGTLARGAAFTPPATASLAPAPSAAPAAPAIFAGSFFIKHRIGAEAVVELQLQQDGGALKGELVMPTCGKTQVALAASPTGQVSGALETFNGARNCVMEKFTVTGQIGPTGLQISMSSIGARAEGRLAKQN